MIHKVDRFLRGPRRALGRGRVTIIGGHTILSRGDIFSKGPKKVFSKIPSPDFIKKITG